MGPGSPFGRPRRPVLLKAASGCAWDAGGRQYDLAVSGRRAGRRTPMLSAIRFQIILWGLAQLLRYATWRHPAFRARLKERNLIAQFKARDEEIGRWFAIRDGRIASASGLREDADVTVAFKNARLGVDLLLPPIDWLDQINAQKDFKLTVEGPE